MSAGNTGGAPRPLDGMRVVEMGQILAGPFASTLLAYFGAEVIKIEPPGSGDPIRSWRITRNGTSLWWWSHARNKKSVTVNLKHAEGQAIVLALLRDADALVENFRPGQMEKWNLGPDVVREANPELIYTRVSGYGQTGPYAHKPGFASVCEGFGGLRYVNGFPDEIPVRANLSIGDTLAGMHAAFGILLAYINRLKGSPQAGQVVDVSIFESVFNMMEGVVPEYSGAGVIREPSGSTITGIVPSNTYRCGDGTLIVIGANTDSMYRRLMEAIGRHDLADEPALAHNAGRVEAQARIDGAIADWAGTVSGGDALALLERAAVAAGPIYNVAQMFNDPQYQARELFEEVEVEGEPLHIPAMVPRLTETPGRTDWPGPSLGEHTQEVLSTLPGYDAERLERLRADGVI
ncbi:MAG: CaiB/BaiF CoA-transferase family protein [Pseudomonadota bacterium]